MKINVCHNGDDVFVAWKPDGFIEDCRGFALFRRRNGVEEVVSTWVGFEKDEHEEGERRASTNWPIQKYQWTDYMADPGDKLQYRVVPMVGPDKDNLRRRSTTQRANGPSEITLVARGRAEDRGLFQPRDRCRAMGFAPARHHRRRPEDGKR